jgi:hypothetical protein
VPIRDLRRDLSIERIWSPKTLAGDPRTSIRASPGKSESTLLVTGRTTTREPYRLQESFEMTTADRVFRISVPRAGSRATR